MMLWNWEVTWTLRDVRHKAVNCNKTPKCPYKTEVMLGLNNRCTEYKSVQPHTEIQILKGVKSVSQFQTGTTDGAGDNQLCTE